MFSHAFVENSGDGTLRKEEQILSSQLARCGVEVTRFAAKDIRRRRLPLTSDSFVSGDVDVVHGALRQLQVPLPQLSDYPEPLRPFLGRRVWHSSLKEVEQRFLDGDSGPLFVKPAERRKAFTGRVLNSWEDLRSIGGASRSQKVWCSEVVTWKS